MNKFLIPAILLLACSSCKLIATTSSTTAYNDLDRKWFMMTQNEQETKREFTRYYLTNHQEIKKDIASSGGEHFESIAEILNLSDQSAEEKLGLLKGSLADLNGDRVSSERLYQLMTR